MSNRNLDDLLWSIDQTVRNVLDSQEIRNLGNDIKDSLNRAGEDISNSFKNFGSDSDSADYNSGWGADPREYSGSQSGEYQYHEEHYSKPQGGNQSGIGYNPGDYQEYHESYASWERYKDRTNQRGSCSRSRSSSWRSGNHSYNAGNSSWVRPGREGKYSGQSGTVGYQGQDAVIPYKVARKFKRGLSLATSIMGSAAAFFGVCSIGIRFLQALDGIIPFYLMFYEIVGDGVVAGIGAALGLYGAQRYLGKKRMEQIWLYLKGMEFCRISDISERIRITDEKTVKLLHKMIKKNILPSGRLDETESYLMLTDETYNRYTENKKKAEQEEEKKEEDTKRSAMAQTVEEGSRYIHRIREINNELPEPVITAKLDELERVCQQIFGYVSDHPDKLSDIRKFISYYLPTTLKLLEAYRGLVHQNTGSENEEKTEKEILAALDNINLAFHNLLDDLMKADYVDLSSDISALNSMLAREGLVDEFTASNSGKTASEKKKAANHEPHLTVDAGLNFHDSSEKEEKDSYEPKLHI